MSAEQDWLVTVSETEALFPPPPAEQFLYRLQHGTMKAGLYAPRGTDPQGPHKRDELYVVWRGSGIFFRDGERKPFGPGDVIFVPAHMEHRFEDFSDDFATWVIFWGPEGGEKS
jgi:mannose-6-phosphate isomerase-like protein (cupin superfamily)